jgi:hypothetical protein
MKIRNLVLQDKQPRAGTAHNQLVKQQTNVIISTTKLLFHYP